MKKLISVVACMLLLAMLFSACSMTPATVGATQTPAEGDAQEPAAEPAAEGYKYKVGVTYPDLTNPIWAEFATSVEDFAKSDYNTETVILDAKNDANAQIEHIENFIADDCDAIIVGAVVPGALDDVCKKALDAGIVVMAFAEPLKNYTTMYTDNQYDLGYTSGTQIAEWINTHLDGKAQVGMLNYPESEQIVIREQGIRDAIAEKCPAAEIVMTASATTADVGMSATENFLQVYPDMKIIASIGDGGAIGANSAVKAAGKATEDFGIFGIDGSIEAMQCIANGDPLRGTISMGAGWEVGRDTIKFTIAALEDPNFVKDNYSELTPVSAENIKELVPYWGYENDIDLSKMN